MDSISRKILVKINFHQRIGVSNSNIMASGVFYAPVTKREQHLPPVSGRKSQAAGNGSGCSEKKIDSVNKCTYKRRTYSAIFY